MKRNTKTIFKTNALAKSAKIFVNTSLIGAAFLAPQLATNAFAQITFMQSPPVAKSAAEPPPNVILSVDDSGSMRGVDSKDNNNRWESRMSSLKGALREAFGNEDVVPDNRIRLAFQAMWTDRGFGPNRLNPTLATDNSMQLLDASKRRRFLRWVDNLQPRDWTPSHAMFIHAGEYLRGYWSRSGALETAADNSHSTKGSLKISPNKVMPSMVAVTPSDNPWNTKPGGTSVADQEKLSCRRAFHIFLTDGMWNSASGRVNPNLEIESSLAYNNTTHNIPAAGKTFSINDPQTKVYRYSGNRSFINRAFDFRASTLSDLAQYYWEMDTQPTIENKISPYMTVNTDETINGVKFEPFWNPKNNPSTWQGMTTYTIGFGGDMNQSIGGIRFTTADGMYGANFRQKVQTGWTNDYVDAHRINITPAARAHDLWQAAYNGRGKYFYAETRSALTQAFKDILKDISVATSSGGTASAGGSSDSISTGDLSFWASYKLDDTKTPVRWAGGIDAKAGAAGDVKWTSSIPSRRTLITSNQSGQGIALTTNSLVKTWGEVNLKGGYWNLGDNYTATIEKIRSLHLHDIVNSQLTFVAAPRATFRNADYQKFSQDNKDRKRAVYVGANDGMLHAFDAGKGTAQDPGSGVELFAYMPRGVQSKVHKLFADDYLTNHEYFVDGSPYTADVKWGNSWKTILVGTLGAGGKGFYILDITNPENVSETSPQSLVLTDKTYSATATNADADIGYQFNQPVNAVDGGFTNAQIQQIKIQTGGATAAEFTSAVIMGNGYNSTNGHPVLLVQTHNNLYKVDACKRKASDSTFTNIANCLPTVGATSGSGLSAPRAVDLDGDDAIDVVYAGDLNGNIWKFNISDPNPSNWGPVNWDGESGANHKPLFAAFGPTGARQPITAAPVVVSDPVNGGVILGVGTGRNLSLADAQDFKLNTVYGLRDQQKFVKKDGAIQFSKTANHPISTDIPSNLSGTREANSRYPLLVKQNEGNLSKQQGSQYKSGATSIKEVTELKGKRGWYYDLPEVANGNATKVLRNPWAPRSHLLAVISENVGASTSADGNASIDSCGTTVASSGIAQINYFNLATGNNPDLAMQAPPGVTIKGQNRFELNSNTILRSATKEGEDLFTPDGDSISTDFEDASGRRTGWRIIE